VQLADGGGGGDRGGGALVTAAVAAWAPGQQRGVWGQRPVQPLSWAFTCFADGTGCRLRTIGGLVAALEALEELPQRQLPLGWTRADLYQAEVLYKLVFEPSAPGRPSSWTDSAWRTCSIGWSERCHRHCSWRHGARTPRSAAAPSCLTTRPSALPSSVTDDGQAALGAVGWELPCDDRFMQLNGFSVEGGTWLQLEAVRRERRRRHLAFATEALGTAAAAATYQPTRREQERLERQRARREARAERGGLTGAALAAAAAPAPPQTAGAAAAGRLERETFKSLWKLPWENRRKVVMWELALDGLPTPARLHRDSPCLCGRGGSRPGRRHVYWECSVARRLVGHMQRQLPEAAGRLACSHLWLCEAPDGVDEDVWRVVSLAALQALDRGRAAVACIQAGPRRRWQRAARRRWRRRRR